MVVTGFHPVRVYSNWCEIDCLDDYELMDGEQVDVQWRDGVIERTTVRVDKGAVTLNDMGHDWQGRDHRAFIDVRVHGEKVPVFLRYHKKVLLKRVSAPKAKARME